MTFATTYGITLPATTGRKRGGNTGKYPFETLGAPRQATRPVFDSDGVTPVLNKDKTPKTEKVFAEDGKTPVMEYASFGLTADQIGKDKDGRQKTATDMTSTIYSAMRRYAKDVKDGDGKPALDDKGKPKFEKVRDFVAFDVDPTKDPEGVSIRVFRTL